jgi:hypothetical protein
MATNEDGTQRKRRTPRNSFVGVCQFDCQCKECSNWYPLVSMEGDSKCECGGMLEKRTAAQVKAAWKLKPPPRSNTNAAKAARLELSKGK